MVIDKSCVSNIIPGVSGEQEARRALENCATIEKKSIVREEGSINSMPLITYQWRLSPRQRGQINVVSGTVNSLALELTRGTALGEFMNELGTPDSLSATYHVYEQCTTSITLDYPNKGISLGIDRVFDCATREGFLLEPETNVTAYYRYKPDTLDNVLKTVIFMRENAVAGNKAHRQVWNGYGEIQINP